MSLTSEEGEKLLNDIGVQVDRPENPGAYVVHRFKEAPPCGTYIMALCAGPYHKFTNEDVSVCDVP